ncbi:hypothetical protein [Enterobacter asburiae]|uniref:hypothetical protein n=1 Tax=Enterobacter asburiae TaxID=61645 RepID=UPI003BE30059
MAPKITILIAFILGLKVFEECFFAFFILHHEEYFAIRMAPIYCGDGEQYY